MSVKLIKELGWKRRSTIRKNRRETIFKFEARKNHGTVFCFVCKQPVERDKATLEHIVPLAKGGSDDFSNLAISHFKCNVTRPENK